MLAQLKLILECDRNTRLNYNASSLLQGVIMEHVCKEYGKKMHDSSLKPYSQYIVVEKERITWMINTVNEEAKNQIINPLLSDEVEYIELKHKQLKLQIIEKELKIQALQDMIQDTYFGKADRRVTVSFVSPTTFKSNGEFALFPSVRLIFQSLMNKFDAFSPESTIGSMELLNDLEENVRINDYRLRSYRFHLEGNFVPSFLGEITFQIRGPQQLANVVHLLLQFGQYSGVGVKSAIGMGGLKIHERRAKDESSN